MVPYRSSTKVNQSETTLKYFEPLQTHKYQPHTLTHLVGKETKRKDSDVDFEASKRSN